MARQKNDLLQGTLALLVLRTLASNRRMHGYAITTHIQRASADLLRVEEGSLYPALHRMEQEGWVRSEWGLTDRNRQARFYALTPRGRKQLAFEEASWAKLTEGVGRVSAIRESTPMPWLHRLLNAFRASRTLLCGVFPAVRSTRGASLQSGGGRTQVSTVRSAQWLLVVVQLALSVTLLAGAGLLLRSGHALSRVAPGFDPAGVLAFKISGHWGETAERDHLVQRIDGTIDALAALPGSSLRRRPGVCPACPANTTSNSSPSKAGPAPSRVFLPSGGRFPPNTSARSGFLSSLEGSAAVQVPPPARNQS